MGFQPYLFANLISKTFLGVPFGFDKSYLILILFFGIILFNILNKIIPKNKIKIKYDLSKPNGTPRKVLDIKLANKYGWKPKTKLNEAIIKTYKNFLENNKIV